MAATDLVRASTRVAMVAPPKGLVTVGIAELRAEPAETSELVDQAHLTEMVIVLGERSDWRYVQGPDQYFGWVRADQIFEVPGSSYSHVVAVLLADVHEHESRESAVIERLPAGTRPPQMFKAVGIDGANARPEWAEVPLRGDRTRGPRSGFLAVADTTRDGEVPARYPTADDYLKTAESFMGVPYLWGGTTALGLDCSGLVQQVYRLNGVALPRDADQQAMLGRRVEKARAGDLMFFGDRSVTHVALATSPTEFIHAPMKGGVVEHNRLGGDRKLLGIRRYLPDVSTE
ncbi:MAG: NlpC/P60 family protein [Chloroflexi bacterium]|nr:MAG: NlpC/P60 family protein [Chloroflexota bacterium]